MGLNERGCSSCEDCAVQPASNTSNVPQSSTITVRMASSLVSGASRQKATPIAARLNSAPANCALPAHSAPSIKPKVANEPGHTSALSCTKAPPAISKASPTAKKHT